MIASIPERMKAIGDIPVPVPETGDQIRYADSPGVDAVRIRDLALTLDAMDPGVLEYHAEGRVSEFLDGFDLDRILERIRCEVLLLQGDPARGGMMTDGSVMILNS